MFRRQRHVPLARKVLAENLLASLLIGSVRSTADVTVHQSLGPARTVTLLQTLRMAVADLQHGRFGQLQFPSFHSAQHNSLALIHVLPTLGSSFGASE